MHFSVQNEDEAFDTFVLMEKRHPRNGFFFLVYLCIHHSPYCTIVYTSDTFRVRLHSIDINDIYTSGRLWELQKNCTHNPFYRSESRIHI